VYAADTPLEPDRQLSIDADAVAWLSEWYLLGEAALRDVAPTGEQTLWPEHFDLAVTFGAVNLGVSPGDSYVDDPYVYVGPHERDGLTDPFWNAPFGASRPWREIADEEAAAAFFREGLERAQP
jgi:hypothetical protein